MQSDTQRMQELERRIGLLETQRQASAVSAGRWRVVAVLAIVAALLLGGAQPGATESSTALEERVKALESKVSVLETKLTPVTRIGQDIYITGANLHIRNGIGRTDRVNGYGNLIIGYNELRPQFPTAGSNDRTGSHNLVLSAQNSYSSYGGIVAGYYNTLRAPYACITGGRNNTVEGSFASVTGGYANLAEGSAASVNGGRDNRAQGDAASITGGYQNFTTQQFASVTGGRANEVHAQFATISGGYNHQLVGTYDWLAGSLFQNE